jgi:hypothetical protein
MTSWDLFLMTVGKWTVTAGIIVALVQIDKYMTLLALSGTAAVASVDEITGGTA